MNTRRALISLIALLTPGLALGLAPRQPDVPAKPITTFVSADVYVDAGDNVLAAYQVEFIGTLGGDAGAVKLVGIEGGGAQGAAFSEPPGYDPDALAGGGRVILADFSTASVTKLSRGKVRVARLHLQIQTPAATPNAAPEYTVKLIAAGTPDGTHIHATASVEGEGR